MNINRRTGRTTRLIDKAIQDLFNNGKVLLLDHYQENEKIRHSLSERMARFIKIRLKTEHQHELFILMKDRESHLMFVVLKRFLSDEDQVKYVSGKLVSFNLIKTNTKN